MELLDIPRKFARGHIRKVAKFLNKATNGRLTPNSVTITGVIMHLPIAYLISQQYFVPAAILLVIFGLFDTLDGELARLQKSVSEFGMILDASTDRLKEIMLFVGITYYFISSGNPYMAVWVVAACGTSVLVSYLKSLGKIAAANAGLSDKEVHDLLRDGWAPFEVRMTMMVIGLLLNQLPAVVIIILVLSGHTALKRLLNMHAKL
jgi:CDP-diacylglycerol--glycerol-3-phosphate 3-phosphatidyltransferase